MMNKALSTLFLFLFFLPAIAQQIPKNTFEHETTVFFNVLKKGGNFHRKRVIVRELKEAFGKENVRQEAIDWFGLYKNVIYEKKGRTDTVVYVTCHYDKTVTNILTLVNVNINGFFDFLLSPFCLSDGIYDNGSGVAIALRLATSLKNTETQYTYRFLFCGMEEVGLRGSRRHVAGLSKQEWTKVKYNLNIDMVGNGSSNKVYYASNYASPLLVGQFNSMLINDSLGIELKSYILEGGLSDFIPFKGHGFAKDFSFAFQVGFAGAIIPQKSYFAGKKDEIPTISFSDNYPVSINDINSMRSLFAHGQIHSFNDNISKINFGALYSYYTVLYHYILAH